MPDPEGFKLGSAWMSVKPNIDQAEWDAKISAAVAEAGKAQGSPLGRSLTKSLEDARPDLVRDAEEIGAQVGDRIGASSAEGLDGGLRAASTRIVSAGQVAGADVAAGIDSGLRKAKPDLVSAGQDAGSDIADGVSVGVDGRLRDARGRFVASGKRTGEDIGAGIGDGLSTGVDDGLANAGPKIKDRAKKTGQDAGNATAQGMSPLIISALAGAGTIGGPLLLAGLGTAMVGATALVLRQNKVISGDFAQVGKDAANAVETAAAPLAGQMHQSLLDVDQQVRALRPDFKELFSAAEPDIAAVTTGLTGFAGTLLPEVGKAVASSQVIVSDFSKSLPVLGSDIGGFFTGLVQNADQQGNALEATINALGNTIHTAGSLIGAASAATAEPLIGLTHVVNGLDDAVRTVATPATVGGVLGLFGAMKLDPAIASGLLTGAEGLSKLADKAVPAGGVVGKLGGAASGTSVALSKMAGIVDGPWGLAIGAGIGLASGLVSVLSQADDATRAITVSQGNLAAAVAQDNAKAGEATSAFLAQQAQASGLADEAKNAGVSLSLLTEAATGNEAAMSQLTAVTGAANEVSRQQQLTAVATLEGQQQLAEAHEKGSVAVNTLYSSTVQLASGQDQLNSAFTTGSTRLAQGLVASDSLTASNQQLLNSVRAQTQQVADAIEKQVQLDAAMADLNNTTNIFNATMDADYQKLVSHAQATADSTVAALNLGSGQSTLNQSLAASIQQYQLASGGAQAYDSMLTAMSGTMNTLLGAEAGFTTALAGVTAAAQANGRSLDVNDAKGALNIQTFTQLASSADKAADAVYQNEVSTKGASVAYQDANAKLLAEKQAFIDSADKAGFNQKAVRRLADELYNLPHDVPVAIHADTSSALQSVNAFISRVNASTGTVQVYASTVSAAGGKALGANAGGGPVAAGSMSTVGEHGEETAVFGQDAYILTHGQTVAMQSRPSAAGAGTTVNATFNYYGPGAGQPTGETRAQMMRDLSMAIA